LSAARILGKNRHFQPSASQEKSDRQKRDLIHVFPIDHSFA
jgi:hypothetical protein